MDISKRSPHKPHHLFPTQALLFSIHPPPNIFLSRPVGVGRSVRRVRPNNLIRRMPSIEVSSPSGGKRGDITNLVKDQGPGFCPKLAWSEEVFLEAPVVVVAVVRIEPTSLPSRKKGLPAGPVFAPFRLCMPRARHVLLINGFFSRGGGGKSSRE